MKFEANVNLYTKPGSLKAFASLSIDEAFVIRKLTVRESENGLFVSMPSYKQGGEYKDVCFPLEENNNKIDSLNEKMREALYKNSTGEITTDELDEICAEIMRESKKLRDENQKYKMEMQMKGAEQARLKQIFEAIDHMSGQMTEFDDETVRAVVERIDVMSANKIVIWLVGGISYEKELNKAA